MSIETTARQHVFMFKPRFVAPILTGTKRQTVRGKRVREVRPGDWISCRKWTETAYRSPQKEIHAGTCIAVTEVRIRIPFLSAAPMAIELDGCRLTLREADDFARRDGFDALWDMQSYYANENRYEFDGIVIQFD